MNGDNFWAGAFMGAISGGISTGVNATLGAMGMAANNLGTMMLSGAIGGGLTSVAFGGDFWKGAGQGALSGALSWGINQLWGDKLTKWAGDDPFKIAGVNAFNSATIAAVRGQDVGEAAVTGAAYSLGSSAGETILNKLSGKVEVEVLIYDNGTSDTHFYGHADIAIGDTVYAYGRFDPDAVQGSLHQNGDGVLLVTNKQDWIQRALNSGSKVYAYKLNVSAAEAGKIEQFFKSEISKNGNFWKTDEKGANMYKFTGKYQTYHAIGGPNCATVTMDALKTAVGDRMNWSLKNAVTPAMVKKGLDAYVVPFSDLIYGNNKLVSEKVYYK